MLYIYIKRKIFCLKSRKIKPNHDKGTERRGNIFHNFHTFHLNLSCRDGEMFKHILNYMRTGRPILPDNFGHLELLLEEARYYELQGKRAGLWTGETAD